MQLKFLSRQKKDANRRLAPMTAFLSLSLTFLCILAVQIFAVAVGILSVGIDKGANRSSLKSNLFFFFGFSIALCFILLVIWYFLRDATVFGAAALGLFSIVVTCAIHATLVRGNLRTYSRRDFVILSVPALILFFASVVLR